MIKEMLWNLSRNLKRFSIQGWIRYIRLRIQGKSIMVTGQCRLCGSCCSKISLEAHGRWVRTPREFAAIVKKFPEYGRFVMDGRDSQGFMQFSCSWRTSDGLCGDHAKRLSICRNFPDKSLYFCGGEVPNGCGYQLAEIVPFTKFLDDELKKQQ